MILSFVDAPKYHNNARHETVRYFGRKIRSGPVHNKPGLAGTVVKSSREIEVGQRLVA